MSASEPGSNAPHLDVMMGTDLETDTDAQVEIMRGGRRKHRRHRRAFSYSHCIDDDTNPPSVSFKKERGWMPEKTSLGVVRFVDKASGLVKNGHLCEDGVSISAQDGVFMGVEAWLIHSTAFESPRAKSTSVSSSSSSSSSSTSSLTVRTANALSHLSDDVTPQSSPVSARKLSNLGLSHLEESNSNPEVIPPGSPKKARRRIRGLNMNSFGEETNGSVGVELPNDMELDVADIANELAWSMGGSSPNGTDARRSGSHARRTAERRRKAAAGATSILQNDEDKRIDEENTATHMKPINSTSPLLPSDIESSGTSDKSQFIHPAITVIAPQRNRGNNDHGGGIQAELSVIDSRSVESWTSYSERLQVLDALPSLRAARQRVAVIDIQLAQSGNSITRVHERALNENRSSRALELDGGVGGVDITGINPSHFDQHGGSGAGSAGSEEYAQVREPLSGSSSPLHAWTSLSPRDSVYSAPLEQQSQQQQQQQQPINDKTLSDAGVCEQNEHRQAVSNRRNGSSEVKKSSIAQKVSSGDLPKVHVNTNINDRVSLFNGDVSLLDASVLILPATERLTAGDNVGSQFAHIRAGRGLAEECRRAIVDSQRRNPISNTISRDDNDDEVVIYDDGMNESTSDKNTLAFGSIVVTDTQRLPCQRALIHVVTPNSRALLEQAMTRALLIAEQQELVMPSRIVTGQGIGGALAHKSNGSIESDSDQCMVVAISIPQGGSEDGEKLSDVDAVKACLVAVRKRFDIAAGEGGHMSVKVMVCVHSARQQEICEQVMRLVFPSESRWPRKVKHGMTEEEEEEEESIQQPFVNGDVLQSAETAEHLTSSSSSSKPSSTGQMKNGMLSGGGATSGGGGGPSNNTNNNINNNNNNNHHSLSSANELWELLPEAPLALSARLSLY